MWHVSDAPVRRWFPSRSCLRGRYVHLVKKGSEGINTVHTFSSSPPSPTCAPAISVVGILIRVFLETFFFVFLARKWPALSGYLRRAVCAPQAFSFFLCTWLLSITRGLIKKKPSLHNMVVCLKGQNASSHTIVTEEVEQKGGGGLVFWLIIHQCVLLLICDAGFRICEYEKGRDFASCFVWTGIKIMYTRAKTAGGTSLWSERNQRLRKDELDMTRNKKAKRNWKRRLGRRGEAQEEDLI